MRITEAQLRRIVSRILREQDENEDDYEDDSDADTSADSDDYDDSDDTESDSGEPKDIEVGDDDIKAIGDAGADDETPDETKQRLSDYLKSSNVKSFKDLTPDLQKRFKRGMPSLPKPMMR